MKAHPDYRAAKAGDAKAAARLVHTLVSPATIAEASARFGPNVTYVPVIAEEASGRNKIPLALAKYYARRTGAAYSDAMVQSNRAYHTGARPLERLASRPMFDGPVESGRGHVVVDDVSVLGGSLAEASNHIQSWGGAVTGIVLLVKRDAHWPFSC